MKTAHPERRQPAPKLVQTMAKAPAISEHQLQRQVAAFLDRALPAGCFCTSIDSAGRGPVDGARMKRRGVKRGIADMLVIVKPPETRGLFPYGSSFALTMWIELKSAKGRLTPEQQIFKIAVEAAGHRYAICRSLEQVETVLLYVGIPLRCKVAA